MHTHTCYVCAKEMADNEGFRHKGKPICAACYDKTANPANPKSCKICAKPISDAAAYCSNACYHIDLASAAFTSSKRRAWRTLSSSCIRLLRDAAAEYRKQSTALSVVTDPEDPMKLIDGSQALTQKAIECELTADALELFFQKGKSHAH